MKKQSHLFIFLLFITTLNTVLPAVSLAQQDRFVSLLPALQSLSRSQQEYTIDILSDGLGDLRTTANVKGLPAPEAVKRLCRGLPVKVKVHGRKITVQYDKRREVRKLKLNGEVQDIRAHKPLIGATVELLDADSTVLQQTVAKHHWWGSGEDGKVYEWDTSEFSFTVPALPAKYIFRISFVGHRTAYVDYKLERVGRREHERALPPLYLAPVSTMLPEVPVTASRVKFYYKGDTIIYNADAFILAEGSMLDALISQLPGVELKRDGRIYHEGKFVDDLLLNGKQFFSNDRKLMLENLPAYTVKDIAIYDKQTDENEWLGIKDRQTQHHVIDVRLKKEYMVGWIANAEVGARPPPPPPPVGRGLATWPASSPCATATSRGWPSLPTPTTSTTTANQARAAAGSVPATPCAARSVPTSASWSATATSGGSIAAMPRSTTSGRKARRAPCARTSCHRAISTTTASATAATRTCA